MNPAPGPDPWEDDGRVPRPGDDPPGDGPTSADDVREGPVAQLMRPSRLRPVEVDLRAVFLVGIGLWLVTLVVALVLTATGTLEGRVVPISVAGIALGGLALVWEHRRRQRLGGGRTTV